ncbi:hypothetical protein ATK74_2284 [Propionicimonas paludicola]|uniref:Uncharacterized protein n=1 Tax=Propionicimonas paludicola TaxID=185243 RepID=A0A2A9CUA5_9ACTN|nr:hypothetical protein [Propionicimonas paludicola]PFG17711.1 hypothetical protein ATK74_2284 [Propionicimonas paludicola]
MLVSAALVAIATAFLGFWGAIASAVIAIGAGVFATVRAWGEVRETRFLLLSEQAADAFRSAAEVASFRLRTDRTIDEVIERNQGLQHSLDEARAEAGRLQLEVAQLRGDKAALRAELGRRMGLQEAQILALPTRGRDATLADLWDAQGFPTVVLLRALANPPGEGLDELRQA